MSQSSSDLRLCFDRLLVAHPSDDLSDEMMHRMWCGKLGLVAWEGSAEVLWVQLEPMLRQSAVDWTIFWRQLAEVVAQGAAVGEDGLLVEPLQQAFYAPLTDTLLKRWAGWLRRWLAQVSAHAICLLAVDG